MKPLQSIIEQLQAQVDKLPPEYQQEITPLLNDWRAHSTPLHESQEYLQAIFENIKDYAIYTVDLENKIASWNTGAERIFGYMEDEAIGQNGEVMFTPEDRERGEPQKEMTEAREKGRAEDERWHIRKDGSRFFARGLMQPMYDGTGALQGFIKVARDVTERLQMEQAEQEQRALAESLHEIAIVLSGSLNLDEVLELILDTVSRVVPHDAGSILLIEGDVISRVHSRGYSEAELNAVEVMITQQQLLVDEIPPFHQIVRTHKPLLIEDLREATDWNNIPLTASACSYLIVPIFAKEGVAGLLNLTHNEPNFFTSKHIDALQAFASHAAIAIRNAQLYIHGQELAALQEREQLARDLHDAVTQTLFTMSMISEALPHFVDQGRKDIKEQLVLLNQLARGSLSEMRVLLLQLRPADLLNKKLSELIRQLVDAIQGRKEISIKVNVTDEPELPQDIHIALYRITQEALNNIVKHSRASSAVIDLETHGGIIEIRIRDNGRGITPQPKPTGMGLQMMRERAEAINAHLEINRLEEGGTEVIVVWPRIAVEGEGSLTSADSS
jgi:PAS domain S-box-containing protein